MIEIVCCPICKAKLKQKEKTLLCEGCGNKYQKIDNVFDFSNISITEETKKTVKQFGESWKIFDHIEDYHKKQFLEWIYPFKEEDFKDKVVLEAGCGKGRHTVIVSSFKPKHLFAVDLSEAIFVAEKVMNNLPLSAGEKEEVSTKGTLPTGNVVIANSSSEHSQAEESLIETQSLRDLLRRKGKRSKLSLRDLLRSPIKRSNLPLLKTQATRSAANTILQENNEDSFPCSSHEGAVGMTAGKEQTHEGAVGMTAGKEQTHSSITLVRSDLKKLPFSDNSFDIVFCVGVLHHIDKMEEALNELWRVLKQKGKLILWVYAREGNNFIVHFLNPIRKHITSKIPTKLLRIFSFPLTLFLYFLLKTVYGPLTKWGKKESFLYYSSYLGYISPFPFKEIENIVVDHLCAPVAYYLSKEEIEKMAKPLKPSQIQFRWHNKNSWNVVVEK